MTQIAISQKIFEKKYNEAKLTEAFNTSVRLGFLNWDTAAVYGMGSCEKLLGGLISGKAIRCVKDKLVR